MTGSIDRVDLARVAHHPDREPRRAKLRARRGDRIEPLEELRDRIEREPARLPRDGHAVAVQNGGGRGQRALLAGRDEPLDDELVSTGSRSRDAVSASTR